MRKWIVTVGGAGLLPYAPGTWGSLFISVILLLIYVALDRNGGALSIKPFSVGWNGILIAGLFLFSILSIRLGRWAILHFKRKDPGPFVLDEAAGICLTLLFQRQWHGWTEAWVVLAAFAAFRVFDITKPPPARLLEWLPGGWGILLDDLMAAVYANLVCQLILRLLLPALGGR